MTGFFFFFPPKLCTGISYLRSIAYFQKYTFQTNLYCLKWEELNPKHNSFPTRSLNTIPVEK